MARFKLLDDEINLIKGEGIEGLSYHLNATEHVGRKQGAVLFPEDSYLSGKHATFLYRDNLPISETTTATMEPSLKLGNLTSGKRRRIHDRETV